MELPAPGIGFRNTNAMIKALKLIGLSLVRRRVFHVAFDIPPKLYGFFGHFSLSRGAEKRATPE